MSTRTKTLSKLSTLDAAKAIYFIIVALAIRESLPLLSPVTEIENYEATKYWTQIILGLGFVLTALRFSHGIAMLYGYEKERVEQSTLPSPRRVLLFSLFLISLGMLFFLMAHNLASHRRTFSGLAVLMFLTDLAYICASGVIRRPWRLIGRSHNTIPGFPSRAALQWIWSDLVLIAICASFLCFDGNWTSLALGSVLIIASVLDYSWNRRFYFGGSHDKRDYQLIFIASPVLMGGCDDSEDTVKNLSANTRRTQEYCKRMMIESRRVPLAYNAFATYFIDYTTSAGKTVGYECAAAYINACDAMYLYLPFDTEKKRLFSRRTKGVPDIDNLKKYSKGMPELVEEAKKLGLDIRYRKHMEFREIPGHSDLWPTGFPASVANYPGFDYALIRKRVYVCSYLRGLEFDSLSIDKKRSRPCDNIRSSLWYCAQLVGAAPECEKKKLAPFATQAFYPYFWNILDTNFEKNAEWEQWFEQALHLVKAAMRYSSTYQKVFPTGVRCRTEC